MQMSALDFPTARELKFIREQTVHCTTSVTALRREIGALTIRQDNLQQELTSALDAFWEQSKGTRLNGVVEWESNEFKVCRNKVASLEQELQGMNDEFNAMRNFVRDVEPRRGAFDLMPDMRELKAVLSYDIREDYEHKIAVQKANADREREASQNELADLIANLSDDLAKLQANVQQNQWGRQTDYASWVGRLERVEQDVLSRVSEELGARRADITRLQTIIGYGQVRFEAAREPVTLDFRDCNNGTPQRLTSAVGRESPRSPMRHVPISIIERLDKIDQTLGCTGDKHEGLSGALARLEVRSGLAEHRNVLCQNPFNSLHDNFGMLVEVMGNVAEKHAENCKDATGKIEQLACRISAVERLNTSAGVELRKAVNGLNDCRAAFDSKHVALRQQIDAIERLQGETQTSQATDKDIVRRHTKELDFCRTALSKQESVVERLDMLERSFGNSSDSRGQDSLRVQARLEQLHDRLLACEVHGSSIDATQKAHDAMAKETAALHAQHATLRERLDYCESMQSTASDKSATQLENIKASIAQLSAVADRLPHLETRIRDSASTHSEELAVAYSKLDQVQQRISSCEAYASSIPDLKSLCSGFDRDTSLLMNRVDQLSNMVDSSLERQSKEAECGHNAQAQQAADLTALRRQLDDVAAFKGKVNETNDRLGLFEVEFRRANDRWQSQHSPMADRMNIFETALNDKVGGIAKESLAMKDAHARHTKDMEQLRSTMLQLDAVTEHFDTRERKHAEEVAAMGSQLEHLRGCVSACEIQAASLGDVKKAHDRLAHEKLQLEAQQNYLQSRVDSLETMVGDLASEQVKEKESLKYAHEHNATLKASLSYQTAITDRIDSVEQSWKTSVERNSEELVTTKARLENLQNRIADCEAQTASVSELKLSQTREKTALSSQVKENIDNLEAVLREAVRKLSSDADMARRAQTKLVNDVEDVKAAASRHGAVQERLDGVERSLAEELSRISAKLEHMQDRLSGVKASGTLSDAEGAMLTERISDVERAITGLGDEYCKQDTLARALSEQAAYVETLKLTQSQDGMANDRLDRVERMLNESAKNHGQLMATRNHLEQFSSRLAACESQGPLLGDLSKTHADLSFMSDRLEYVEQALQELRVLLTATKPRSPDLYSDQSLTGLRPTSPDIISDRSLRSAAKGRGASAGRLVDIRENASICSNGHSNSKPRGASWAGERSHKELPYSP